MIWNDFTKTEINYHYTKSRCHSPLNFLAICYISINNQKHWMNWSKSNICLYYTAQTHSMYLRTLTKCRMAACS